MHALKSDTTKKVLKVLSIFGGVQMVGIACSIIRTKLAALWLGPVGVGILALYQSTMDLICRTLQLNIDQSAVRDLAMHRNQPATARVMTATVRRICLVLGAAGTLAVILLSPLISLWAFGNWSHTGAFAILSLWIVLAIVTAGEQAIFRGLDFLGQLAKATVYSAVVSLAAAVPLLYFLRADGIVPMLLAYYVIMTIFMLIFRVRGTAPMKISTRQAFSNGREMLRLGGYMTLSNSVTLLASNILIIYLNRRFGSDTVGCYQAGYTLINTYVGIIFTAIVMEYYPRLSTAVSSPMRTGVIVSHEMKVTLWILMPVMVAFICLSPIIIRLLYSSDFIEALPYVTVGATGVFFRAASWCVAFTILARGDGRTFVATEFASAVVYLALHIPLFNLFGFRGLGVAYTVWYFIYFIIVLAVYRRNYRLRLHKGIPALIATGFGTGLLTVCGFVTVGPWITLPVVFIPVAAMALRRLR